MKFPCLLYTIILAFTLLSGCIGTDIIDDTMGELMIPMDSIATDSVLTDNTIRTGTLQGSGGYESKGTVTLSQND